MIKILLENAGVDPWSAAVAASVHWADEQHLSLRDAVFLVPFAQHLPLARQAWSARDTWMPRVETTQTLARSLAPPEPLSDHDICFDAALDGLTARRLLRGQAAFAAWLRRDARAFDQASISVMQTAQAIARAMAAVPPARRAEHQASMRELLGAVGGVGGTERHLARIAFEWAAASSVPSTDAMFAMRPSAWIVVQAGGVDMLTQRLAEAASSHCPVLWNDADPSGDDVIRAAAPCARVQLQVCSGFEDEAQRAAAQALVDLSVHGAPVALIAQDRLLVRRVSALLGRCGVPLHDETGWTLSTTRAGASVGLLLRAAAATATVDEVLDAIKSWPATAADVVAIASLEAMVRRRHWARPTAVDVSHLSREAGVVWERAARATEPLRGAGGQSLVGWSARVRAAMQASGLTAALSADEAGRQVLTVLHLATTAALAGHPETLTLADYARWVDAALEQATYVPTSPEAPAVVVIPAPRAMLRPFTAVVWPGADEKHLGAATSPHPLLNDVEAAALGLPTAAERREREAIAFAQALRSVPVTLLRRTDDDGEPVSPSPLLERLLSARREAGLAALADAADPRVEGFVPAEPVARPLPSAPPLLPDRLSASACEDLRACPYRFFALRMLGLQSADELDGEVEKRDYGTWLHEVLLRFHQARPSPLDAPDDERALAAAAVEAQTEMGIADADFLPFAATFERFAPRYVAWLQGRDRDGAQWLDGERDWTVHPEAWQGTAMHGVIDRIDSVSGDEGAVMQLIDYKTGSTSALRSKVKQPQEDTQLPFYAALAIEQGRRAGGIGPLDAIYLSLDDTQKIVEVRHPDVAHSAEALVAGLGRDLQRLRGGAVLPALGEGAACEHCDARGLCRRDQWAVAPPAAGAAR
jgi:ATP-dependent helicase/nuclease subunit B